MCILIHTHREREGDYLQGGGGQEIVMSDEQRQSTGLHKYENVIRHSLFCMLALVR